MCVCGWVGGEVAADVDLHLKKKIVGIFFFLVRPALSSTVMEFYRENKKRPKKTQRAESADQTGTTGMWHQDRSFKNNRMVEVPELGE